jgi:uncharacterized protein (DUF427 family)
MFAHNIKIEPADYKITLTCNGETVAETERALRLHEPPLLPVYYIPRDDVNMSLITPSRHKTTCPVKGEASYFTLEAGGEKFENAVWCYNAPKDEVAEIMGFIAFSDSVVEIAED